MNMYVLKARNGTLFYLLNLEEFTVGRKECNLLITDDQSISREHAKLFLRNKKPILLDTGAKYGTFINKEKVTPNIETELKTGDEIRFGQLRSFYRLEEITIITTPSSIKGNQRKNLATNISFLGGTVQSNWTAHCTHVTVEEILLTVKVLCALIKGIPIVTLKYWDDYVSNVKNNLPPPNFKDYKPVCSEVTLSKDLSLDFKPERLHLFKNKIFVFPTKNDKAKMVDMIRLAGGDAISWDVNPFTTKDLTNAKNDYIILEMGASGSEDTEPALSTVIKYNTELGKRTVPLQEIALAIINCSCEKDCNPSFDRKGTVLALKTQRMETQHTANILALSTQTQQSSSSNDFQSQEIIQETDEIEIVENKVPELIKEEDITVTARNGLEVKQTTTVKRENETNGETLFNVQKKIKLETKNTEEKQQERMGNTAEPPGKGKFTFKGDLNVNKEQSKQESLNPFSKKRKIPEPNDVDSPAKRNAIVQETSDVALSSSLNINPFALIKAKKSSYASKENAVPSTSKSVSPSNSEPNIVSSTFINCDVPNSLRLDISAIIPVDSTLEKSYRWLSKTKSDESKSSIIKSIAPCLASSSGEVDDDFIKYVESFKNVVVIKTESMVKRRSSSTSNTSHNLSIHNGANFKKFKKVQPLKVQTTIIPESSYVKITCNDRGTVQIVQEQHDSDEDDALRIRAPQRRFVF